MKHVVRASGRSLYTAIVVLALAACSGGSGSTASGPQPGAPGPVDDPTVIQGIATPSSVSVVTATNAG